MTQPTEQHVTGSIDSLVAAIRNPAIPVENIAVTLGAQVVNLNADQQRIIQLRRDGFLRGKAR